MSSKDDFKSIRFQRKTIQKFKTFSSKLEGSYSENLEEMMNFFERHSLSPYDTLGVNMISVENRLKRRMNAMIAIMKDIEKTQTKPTTAMLQALFEETETPKKNLVLEKKYFSDDGATRIDKKQ